MSLGPIFGERAITGPTLIHYFEYQAVHFYLVGEHHNINGRDDREEIGDPKDYVINQISNYAKTKRVRCYCEATERVANYWFGILAQYKSHTNATTAQLANSPLMAYTEYYQSDQIKCNNVYADVRNLPPYNIYKLIISPLDIVLERYGTLSDNDAKTRIRKLAKKAEKMIVGKISNRLQAKQFLESLCLPNKCYPDWFVDLYRETYETPVFPPDILRDMMKKLQGVHPDLYEAMVRHIRSYYRNWAVTPFTHAMRRIESMRHTIASKVVAEYNTKNTRDIFIEITTFLMDIYILLNLFLEATLSKGDTVVIITGAAHTDHITRFFETNFAGQFFVRSKVDPKGRLPAGKAAMFRQEVSKPIPEKLRALKNKE